jgi:hypothetical protein
MGYLDNSSITVDAILTKKGRELLAKGDGSFNITNWALSDDEIDYGLWNASHELGSNYYGVVIENMPIVEASPNQQHVMRHKLVSLDQSVTKLPIISLGVPSIGPLNVGQTTTVLPTTPNLPNFNARGGYTAIISDSDICDVDALESVSTGNKALGTGGTSLTVVQGQVVNNTVTVVGKSFRITAKSLQVAGSTTLTIIGNESGGSKTITITVNADPSA